MAADTFAPPAFSLPSPHIDLPKSSPIVVVGAGAFGGWTALFLRRFGYSVTLVDAWGGGNSRSSSGDETRVIRSTYGANKFYFNLNVRALLLWRQEQERLQKQLFINAGVLWLCYRERNAIIDDSVPFAELHNMPYELLSAEVLRKRYPLVNADDLHHAYFDPFGGYLMARESMQAVQQAFVNEGGVFLDGFVKIASSESGAFKVMAGGNELKADLFLFACGPWLGKMFPDVLSKTIVCTKQEAYYFGVPENDNQAFNQMPAWVDLDGEDFYYGIPGNARRGFKIGVDRRGESFDPTHGERLCNPDTLRKARAFLEHRFPALRDAPLLESRVCPYENSPDGNFIFQKHPHRNDFWFLGGGSGHGFKHGPALGEWVASCVASVNPAKHLEPAT